MKKSEIYNLVRKVIREEKQNLLQNEEANKKLFDIGATLKKIEQTMDFGKPQTSEVMGKLNNAHNELEDVLSFINIDNKEVGNHTPSRFDDNNDENPPLR
jgi:cell fate (sporulation/competence/biofilm development) regulator YlbF (YheA/YmcA/DUF963 family)